MDAARCAKRMGAEKVYIVYRRGEAEMPAQTGRAASREGRGHRVHDPHATPSEILGGEDGRVNGMKCIKMELGEPDASGRRRPIPVEGSEFVLDVDTVIMSLGTSPNPLIRSTTPGLETNKKGGIIVDENEMSTRENVFAGGDAVTGAATVILAMGAGEKSCRSHRPQAPEQVNLRIPNAPLLRAARFSCVAGPYASACLSPPQRL